jgi:hypothetical protein
MKRVFALIAVVLLAACSHATQSTSQSASETSGGSPAPAASNTTDFPLYDGSSVISARAFTQTISNSTASAGKGVFSQGAGTYSGHEVIAHTTASIDQLRSWLDGLEKTPPSGYEPAATGSGVADARNRAQAAGIDFDAFQKTVGGKRHALVVLAIDPEMLQKKAGPMLGFINRYRMLPQSLRDPIDAQAKSRTGFTITEALSPDTPLGAALGALDVLKTSGDRGLVLIDATKQ